MAVPNDAKMKKWRGEVDADLASGRAPNFRLAPLTKLAKQTLLSPDNDTSERGELQRLALTLALIFNDIKDLTWARDTLGHWRPENLTAVEAGVAQHNAMSAFFVRQLCGVTSELGNVVQAKRATFKSKGFEAALKKLKRKRLPAVKAWEQLIVDLGKPGKKADRNSKVGRCIEFIRDKAAHHYGHLNWENLQALANGYRAHFNTEQNDERYQVAFASLGQNMEQSRFFFADAAVAGLMDDALKKEGLNHEDLFLFFKHVGFALRFVVEALIEELAEPK